MKLLFNQPAPDKEPHTVDLICERQPNGNTDWRTSRSSFYEELHYEMERHEKQFRPKDGDDQPPP